jgi:hypothetical protein
MDSMFDGGYARNCTPGQRAGAGGFEFERQFPGDCVLYEWVQSGLYHLDNQFGAGVSHRRDPQQPASCECHLCLNHGRKLSP